VAEPECGEILDSLTSAEPIPPLIHHALKPGQGTDGKKVLPTPSASSPVSPQAKRFD